MPQMPKRIIDEGLHDAHELQSWFGGEIGRYLEVTSARYRLG